MKSYLNILALLAVLAAFPLTLHYAPALLDVLAPAPVPDPFAEAMYELSVEYARRLDGLPDEEAAPVKVERAAAVQALCTQYGRTPPPR